MAILTEIDYEPRGFDDGKPDPGAAPAVSARAPKLVSVDYEPEPYEGSVPPPDQGVSAILGMESSEGTRFQLGRQKVKRIVEGSAASKAGLQTVPPLAIIGAPHPAPEEEGVDAPRATELQPSPQFEQRPPGLPQGPDSGRPGLEIDRQQDGALAAAAGAAPGDSNQALIGPENALSEPDAVEPETTPPPYPLPHPRSRLLVLFRRPIYRRCCEKKRKRAAGRPM